VLVTPPSVYIVSAVDSVPDVISIVHEAPPFQESWTQKRGCEPQLLQALQLQAQDHLLWHIARFQLERCGTDPCRTLDVDQRGAILILYLHLVIRMFRDYDESRLLRLRAGRDSPAGHQKEAQQYRL
jgi:hypothetical protein